MAIDTLSSDELCAAIAELDRCSYNHDQWLEALMGTLICALPPDQRDIDDSPHRKCRLGQWYYSETKQPLALSNRPGFAELGTAHERMHCYAADMLRSTAAGERVTIQQYQRFIAALKNMRLEIAALRQVMEDALQAVDPLTGVPGRFGLLSRLREQQALVERCAQSCCVAMMDLDHFKAVNDAFGHAAGDHVLKACTHHMARGLRPYDQLFRYGGEEFVVVMPETTIEEGLAIIDRLRGELAGVPQELGSDEPVHVTASFGVTPLEPGVLVETSIARADEALYAAKAAGRNRALVWDPAMDGHQPASSRSA